MPPPSFSSPKQGSEEKRRKTGSGSLTVVRSSAGRAMRGSDAGDALRLGFHHRAKVITAQNALLLEVGANGFQSRRGQRQYWENQKRG